MYGIGSHSLVGGGIAGGVLASTGSGSMVAPIIMAAIGLITGGLLLFRARRLARSASGETA